MSHECKNCGQECYCDCEDTGGWQQPANCIHFRSKWECDMHDDWGEREDGEDWADHLFEREHDDQRERLGNVFAPYETK